MKCRHGWITDVYGHAKCQFCGAEKQYPQEKITFRKAELSPLQGYAKDIKIDPESWLAGTVHVML